MNSVFRQHHLLHCQTIIDQCLILDSDVHKLVKPHADKGEQVFIADVLYTDDPYEGVILLSCCEKKNDYRQTIISFIKRDVDFD